LQAEIRRQRALIEQQQKRRLERQEAALTKLRRAFATRVAALNGGN